MGGTLRFRQAPELLLSGPDDALCSVQSRLVAFFSFSGWMRYIELVQGSHNWGELPFLMAL